MPSRVAERGLRCSEHQLHKPSMPSALLTTTAPRGTKPSLGYAPLLEREGYRVIRFWNSEITSDLNAVLERIYVELYGSREAEAAPLKHRRT